MTIDRIRTLLEENGLSDRFREFEASTATVELAAQCLGTAPDRIAKTLSFYGKEGVILVVAAGQRRIDNRKFKDHFGLKAKMLSFEDTERLTGYAPGGVCPFLASEGVAVWFDISLRDHETVYPAAGSSHTCISLSCPELEMLAQPAGWCDVCKPLDTEPA